MTEQPEDPAPLLYGKPRPKPPHYAAIFDEALEVRRTDVTDAIERALRKIPAARLMYPDLYAHKVTEALLRAGLLQPPVAPAAVCEPGCIGDHADWEPCDPEPMED